MLNNKGLAKPEHLFIPLICGILLIGGLIFMSFISSAYSDTGKLIRGDIWSDKSSVSSIDIQFLDIELLNLLRYNFKDDYSFGELLSYLPSNDPLLDTVFDKSSLNGVYSCNAETESKLVYLLNDVIGDTWMISVYNEKNERLFVCAPFTFSYYEPFFASSTLPSSEGDIKVYLEVPNE